MTTVVGSVETTPRVQNKKIGILFACCAMLCWSCTGLLIDAISSHYAITPMEISFWRTLLIVALLAFFLAMRVARGHRSEFDLNLRELPFYFLYGVIGVGVFNVAWSNSVAINKAAIATALLFCYPVFAVFGARLLFKERVGWLE